MPPAPMAAMPTGLALARTSGRSAPSAPGRSPPRSWLHPPTTASLRGASEFSPGSSSWLQPFTLALASGEEERTPVRATSSWRQRISEPINTTRSTAHMHDGAAWRIISNSSPCAHSPKHDRGARLPPGTSTPPHDMPPPPSMYRPCATNPCAPALILSGRSQIRAPRPITARQARMKMYLGAGPLRGQRLLEEEFCAPPPSHAAIGPESNASLLATCLTPRTGAPCALRGNTRGPIVSMTRSHGHCRQYGAAHADTSRTSLPSAARQRPTMPVAEAVARVLLSGLQASRRPIDSSAATSRGSEEPPAQRAARTHDRTSAMPTWCGIRRPAWRKPSNRPRRGSGD
jgi:hypothetical protein